MMILKGTFEKYGVRAWSKFKWLKIVSNSGLMWTRQWTFGFHKSMKFLTM